jgi:Protein of unknown function (DUF3379)
MTCDDARLAIGAEPGATAPALEEHLLGCPGCRQFREEMRALDGNIRRALERAPEAPAARPRSAPAVWRQWALAASVALAVFVGLAVWVLRPSDTLAHDVVAHVQAESDSWLAAQHVDTQSIDAALKGAGVELNITSDRVIYAQSCWFRGHYVPHLVVNTVQGPATVMILKHEHVSGRRTFHEAGMSGVIVPAGTGSIAVLTRGGGNIDRIAGELAQDVRWLPHTS